MADSNPELQAKLQELEHELEEGDITTKGSVHSAPSPWRFHVAVAKGRVPTAQR
jgi:hypothetical protein